MSWDALALHTVATAKAQPPSAQEPGPEKPERGLLSIASCSSLDQHLSLAVGCLPPGFQSALPPFQSLDNSKAQRAAVLMASTRVTSGLDAGSHGITSD